MLIVKTILLGMMYIIVSMAGICYGHFVQCSYITYGHVVCGQSSRLGAAGKLAMPWLEVFWFRWINFAA